MNIHKISFQIKDIGAAIMLEIGPMDLAMVSSKKFLHGAF
jgi:hypothetical protein